MTDQTNTAAFWLDVANVCQQASEACKDWDKVSKETDAHIRDAMLAINVSANSARIAAMNLRNALAMKEIEEVKQLIEEAVDASN